MKLFFMLMIISILYAEPLRATDCYGPVAAESHLVYLHGMDDLSIGLLESENRKVLQSLAHKLNIRIALPRSPQLCNNQRQLCWNANIDTAENAKSQLEHALALSKECFPSGIKPNLLGFSSGGYLANKILRYCLDTEFQAITSVGAAGDTNASDPMNLKACKPLQTLIGKKDLTYPELVKFTGVMRSRGGTVSLTTFEGAHELTFESLKLLLQKKGATTRRGDPRPSSEDRSALETHDLLPAQ